MGLIFGIIICILAFPIGFVAVIMSNDFETGTPTRSIWFPIICFLIPLTIGALVIYSHWHPIGW